MTSIRKITDKNRHSLVPTKAFIARFSGIKTQITFEKVITGKSKLTDTSITSTDITNTTWRQIN